MGATNSARAWVRHLHRNDDFIAGEPMIEHLVRVAEKISDETSDEVTVLVALCHHLEDVPHVGAGMIETKFGVRVTRALSALDRGATPDAPYYFGIYSGADAHARAVARACVQDLFDHAADVIEQLRWQAALDHLAGYTNSAVER